MDELRKKLPRLCELDRTFVADFAWIEYMSDQGGATMKLFEIIFSFVFARRRENPNQSNGHRSIDFTCQS